jgi:tetratricopeptide (TPR) repeat protein
MKKIFIPCLFAILIPVILSAQSEALIDSFIVKGKQQLHHALNTWKEQDLLSARAFFERLQTDPTYSWLIHYYIALADYRIVSFYFSQQNQEQAKKYIDDGIEHLQSCLEMKDDFAEAYSLLSSLYGNKIGTDPQLGMTLGPKSGVMMAKAMKLEPQNPRTQLIAGWSAYFTPEMWGGGKDKAKEHYEQAIAFFDSFKVTDPLLPDWGHDEAYAWLGMAQMEAEEFEAAKTNFNKALEINPEYGWVKYVLLQDLQKKMAAEK